MGEWQEVPSRRSKGRQRMNGDPIGMGDTTKFFISNIPTGCNPWELSGFLGCFREVVGSYIARKRDKEGNRFGFVTFKKVRNAVELEKRMNGVKMGQCRLKVNIAKFAMENIGIWDSEEKSYKNKEKLDNNYGRNFDSKEASRRPRVNVQPIQTGVGLSFKDALDGKVSVSPGNKEEYSCKSIKVPDNVVALFEIRRKSLIGRVYDLKTLSRINKILVENGFGGFDIVYDGGLSLLLIFQGEDDAMVFLMKKEDWSKWFSVLDVWVGQSLPFERVAWLKVHGVPINLATDEIFDDIASQFGKVIHPSQLSLEDGDISVGLVGVLVGDGAKISDSVNLRWKNKIFKTWITEVSGSWDPECIGAVVRKEVAVDAPLDKSCDTVMPESVHDPVTGKVEDAPVENFLEDGEFRFPLHGDFGESQRVHGESQQSLPHDDVFLEKVDCDKVGLGSCEFPDVGEGSNVNIGLVSNNEVGLKSVISPGIVFSAHGIGLKPNRKPGVKIKRGQRAKVFNQSPVENGRPKKRTRQEDDDPFDLDRFIGIVKNNTLAESNVDNGIDGLTSSADSEEDEAKQDDNVDVAIEKEIENTIKVGAALGVDLASHDVLVRKSIEEEGTNVVKL
ncbi:nucleotide-binding alpha-beta plait domain-containing protein [Artemisia annua]|uniref:Nucleotide-binding alpha-beta plait domain-containing protein n=1 Tax=Artemisia annua TaxID=35608 RepID=A0A2U1LSK6_ARTAN|nr:nucleotide-binding alpha-beta plait domain-containing protein [Artemisia annua]